MSVTALHARRSLSLTSSRLDRRPLKPLSRMGRGRSRLPQGARPTLDRHPGHKCPPHGRICRRGPRARPCTIGSGDFLTWTRTSACFAQQKSCCRTAMILARRRPSSRRTLRTWRTCSSICPPPTGPPFSVPSGQSRRATSFPSSTTRRYSVSCDRWTTWRSRRSSTACPRSTPPTWWTLSTEHAEKILDLMEEERSEEIQEILEYPEDSAGRLMSPDVVAVRETSTVEEAVQHIRKTVTEERPFGVYAVDDHQHLIGRVPLRRLLIADPRSLILGILEEEEVVSVNATMDREEMARVVAKYDLVTVPVVDDQNRLIGTITVDDVIDVVEEEASEDIFRMAGSDAAELERRSPGQVAMLRLPWVMLTLLIEMLAGVVIHFFDHTLGKVILLASFMPVIQAISGN